MGGPELGLDSLSLVELLTALESTFDLELERSIWAEQQGLSLGHLIDRIEALSPSEATPQVVPASSEPEARTTEQRAWAMPARLARAARSLHSRRDYLVLERELELPTPAIEADASIEVRLARASDVAGIERIFGPRRGERNAGELRQRIEAGYLCLGAWRDGQWAGIDYLSAGRHRHGFLNLEVAPGEGHVYAFGLHEGARFRGLGVGLKLLAASIDLAREQGYRRQFTIVEHDNERMLSASVQIFGFRVVGQLSCNRIAGRTRTSGQVHGLPLEGRTLFL